MEPSGFLAFGIPDVECVSPHLFEKQEAKRLQTDARTRPIYASYGVLTTIKYEIQQDGTVNWYGSPLDATGMPVRYNWSRISLNECLRALGGQRNRDNTFHLITNPARYWRAAIGLQRAKSISFIGQRFNEQSWLLQTGNLDVPILGRQTKLLPRKGSTT